ncbi:hypothetical protein [Halorubrum cibi]|uniref:Uncharacterized protein n=1 Tax=Halorubrum cibi TaxID=413815 RepID=A0A521C3C7_9EURY|nr:hypothetical protein [Halorubrum cibi]SMO53240.1 hypothetical protein SAMN06264867_103232 [Halorubrum cibi]
MTAPLDRLTELRRALPVTAAAMFVVALTVPVWRIAFEAPQYPDGLLVTLYAYPRLGGDFAEVQALNHYVGFYYPDPVFVDPNYAVHPDAIAAPEWILGPIVFLAVAAAGVFVAVAPTERKLRLGLFGQLIGATVAFVGTFAIVQYRLHQAGHALGESAPVVGVAEFTPPLLGGYRIANISGVAWFGPGGYLAGAGFLLLVVAFLLRDSRITVGEALGALRERLGGRDADESDRDPAAAGSDRDPAAADSEGDPTVAESDRRPTAEDPRTEV